MLEEGEDEDGEDEDGENEDGEDEDGEDEVKIVEKQCSSKKAQKQGGGDDAPALLETSIEPSKSEYPFQS